MALVHSPRLAAMEALEAAVLRIPGVRPAVHRLGGVEFLYLDHELGHLHGNGLLDVRVGAKEARMLVSAGNAELHHVFGESAWVSFWIRTPEDVPRGMNLLQKAMHSHQAPH
jgi:hypothetical protein